MELKAQQEVQALLDLKVRVVRMVPKVQLDQLGQPAHRVLPERQDHKVLRDQQVRKVQQVHKVQVVRTEAKEPQELREVLVVKVHRVRMEARVQQVVRVRKERLVVQARKVQPGRREVQVRKVQQEQVLKEQPVHKEQLAVAVRFLDLIMKC
jgi:hypothetical protein